MKSYIYDVLLTLKTQITSIMVMMNIFYTKQGYCCFSNKNQPCGVLTVKPSALSLQIETNKCSHSDLYITLYIAH